jgi:hypothetical protein
VRILFVTFNYLPSGSAEANLLNNLTASMKKRHGCHIDILTTKCDPAQEDVEERDGLRIFRILSSRAISLRKFADGFDMFKLASLYLEKLTDLICMRNPKRFLVPSLIRNLYRGLKRFKLRDYDVFIPVCAYYETYAAVKKYVRKSGVKGRIVVYQIDPLTGNGSYRKESYDARLKMETDMAKTAASIVTTDIVKEEKKCLKIDTKAVFPLEFPVVTDRTGGALRIADGDAEIKCVFAGYIHKKIRDPEYTFNLFSKLVLPRIRLYILGSGEEDLVGRYNTAYPERFIQVGMVPLQQSLDYIRDADILVNIGNNAINFVPSKIFDYISTGKPIINFYKNGNCPTLKYCNRYENALLIYEGDDVEHQIGRVEAFILKKLGREISYAQIEREFLPCTADYVADAFYKILSEKA